MLARASCACREREVARYNRRGSSALWPMIELSRKLFRALKNAPGVVALRRHRWDRDFASRTIGSCFKGVYPDYGTALAAIPRNRAIGYDNPGSAAMYRERMLRVLATDYPVLYWLRPLLRPGLTVFDLGGHVGVSFYSYSAFLGFPDDVDWLVCDVPAVTRAGAELARDRGRPQIHFTNDRAAANGRDVYLAAGSLQYLDEHFASILARLTDKPAHIMVNMLPVHEEREFVTLNNIGAAICPYTIHHHRRFLERVCGVGYTLVDTWDNPGKVCHIPFFESYSTDLYVGAYFRTADAASQGRSST
jgi:putative methyltransferase (TIGR04325 family)